MKVVIFLFLGAAIHTATDNQVSCINLKSESKLYAQTFDDEDDE